MPLTILTTSIFDGGLMNFGLRQSLYVTCLTTTSILLGAQESTWQSKFNHYNFNPIITALGYDPKITIYEANPDIKNDDQVTIYAHGWGDSQDTIRYFKRNTLMLPGAIIGFNFRDAHRAASLPPFWLSNFCQSGDIASLVSVLKVADECGITTIHLFGHSRGAGTILTMLLRLSKYESYEEFFKKLGIDIQQASRLLEKITQGSIVLHCPVVDPNTILKEKLSWINLGFASGLIRRYILPRLTGYKPCDATPIRAAEALQTIGFKIPTIIHFQKDDVIVTTRIDSLLYRYLQGKNTYVTIDAEGGHMLGGKRFGFVLQAFYKKYGAPYYHNAVALTEGSWLLENAQPIPDYLDALAEDTYTFKRSGIINYANLESVWQQKIAEYDITPITKILGFDPQIRIYGSDTLTYNGRQTTIYVHGLGENSQTIIPYFKLNSYLLPGIVVSFDFPDVIPGTFRSNFSKLSLAQTEDIATLCMVLKILDESGLETMHLFGTSRGGATIVNTLARLCQYEKHTPFFTTLTISKEQAERILNKISKGTIILNVSLVDSKAVARHLLKFAGSAIINTLAPLLTMHRVGGDQAINAAKIIASKNFAILVHFEYKDFIVGNARDAEFYTNIMGPRTYLVLADEGGHIHSGHTLELAIQAFRKQYGGAYYPIPSVLEQGEAILKNAHPAVGAVERFVYETYKRFDDIRAEKTKK